jgi:hypothetical protein
VLVGSALALVTVPARPPLWPQGQAPVDDREPPRS